MDEKYSSSKFQEKWIENVGRSGQHRYEYKYSKAANRRTKTLAEQHCISRAKRTEFQYNGLKDINDFNNF
jgi:hypothetical protein